ncbi:putative subtilisin-like protease-like [Capsicum annuum]|uniref:triacylglycerol lipase OBL1 n=1 Tax=Capsicum annuum TaxID=4072 RepID=UPI001FB04D1D|nr:triacylglycerol lipase OBL1 [Capsicum annuum]KAF3642675.1 putative subtilisin-like protease-like [Capsicum annuum]KAF3685551.1 putative subtilisin-like protease-like [Capsicum annuum]
MANKNEDICKDYFELKPQEASYFDFIRIFYSNNLDKRIFFNVSTGVATTIRGFRRRWLIFISMVMQRLLFLFKNPMANLGSFVELLQNYPSFNGGFLQLFLNILRGKVVRPEKSSEKFMSMIGNLDMRVELDKTIKFGDRRYSPHISIMAAKLSYENEAVNRTVIQHHWQMHFLGLYNFWNAYEEQNSTQAIMFQDKIEDPNLIVVAFRGTNPFYANAWITDIDLSWYDLEGLGKIHAGFMKALGLQKPIGWPKDIEAQQQNNSSKVFAYYKIREVLKKILGKNEKAKFIVTGHSLGGALAILFASVLILHEEEWLLDKLEGVYTFGQPRVGDENFGKFMMEKLKKFDVKYFRYVYCNDMVPRLPYDDKTLFFKHFGSCLFYNSLYDGQVLEEEPNKNYFSLFWVLPKVLNAVFELIRGFILPWIKGSDYKQSWSEIIFRMVGLIIPGLSAHGPVDYVNLTRLGTILHLPQLQESLKHD